MISSNGISGFKKNQYSEGLLFTSGKKNCVNLAETMNVSHDVIYRNLKSSISRDEHSSKELETIAHKELDKENTFLIHDDTQLIKLYAKKIEGLEVGFDGSTKRPCLGIKMMTSLLTDTKVNIPIDTIPYISKELAQSSYKTKSRLALEITTYVIKRFAIKRMLGDAHFATNEMLSFLNDEQVSFLMKVTRTRIVTMNGVRGQLQEILRLKKNSHTRVAKGIINGIECYFYVIKISNESTMYLISNDYIDPYTVVKLYRIRWNIEIFHRTAKQYLGLSDCQMKAIEYQRQHALSVMLAYANASVQTSLMGFHCVEDYINYVRDVKSSCCKSPINRAARSFRYDA